MGLIVSGPGASSTVSSASGGKIYAYNNISNAAGVTVAAANPQRQKVTFHNPGDVDIFVSQLTDGNGNVITATPSVLGGCFRIFANGGTLIVDGECQKAWVAFSASGSGKPFTVMDSNC